MASAHGLSVDNHAVGGTTAAGWAKTPLALREAVNANPNAKYVWLTIGGNDALPAMEQHRNIAEVVRQINADTTAFLKPLFAAHNTIKVVQFGYDILGWDKNFVCEAQGRRVFWECGGSANATCANRLFYNVQRGVEALSASLAAAGTARPGQHTAVDLRGSMQAGAGTPGASAGHPVDALYSPKDMMQGNSIHANDKGYGFIFASLWEAFFAKQEALRLNDGGIISE